MFLQAEEQPQELPAFGAGIEFRPSKKRRQQTMKQDAPAAGATVQMSGLTEDTDESGQFELVRFLQVSLLSLPCALPCSVHCHALCVALLFALPADHASTPAVLVPLHHWHAEFP